ncbi:type II toxin-antitoxin system RelE/ParE family toxin [Pannonibacter sp. I15F10I1]|uniref:type II toxin-antitoxin system RelE/ParE family toxin n=1 Tax=Pannonibacter sp. I15F10I1 TaxID=2003580 RepID=UPI001648E6BE|nr:type II toxin-antitoxin system RelE/ParE family toxin [Pannonibacter sp. I15F10I1]
MIEVRQTAVFRGWFAELKDLRARSRIATVQSGLLGDVKFFDGIGELRIDYGPGYRVYFVRKGAVVIILLCGGDKGSQARDIRKAKMMAADLEE